MLDVVTMRRRSRTHLRNQRKLFEALPRLLRNVSVVLLLGGTARSTAGGTVGGTARGEKLNSVYEYTTDLLQNLCASIASNTLGSSSKV